jgi:hypothetical protein
MPMLDAARKILDDSEDYWPLSDRSVHYELLNHPPLRHASKPNSRYENNKTCYNDLTDLLTRGRLEGYVPFHAIEDPTRKTETWHLHREVGTFVDGELNGFLKGYWRDLQQSQPNYLQILGEKNTVEGSIRDIASHYCVPYTIGRGYCSLDPRKKLADRFRKSGKRWLILLICSDFDPEGEDIPYSFAESMRDDFGIERVLARKVFLTHEQALARDLPITIDPEKKKEGARYKKFVAKYGGDRAHELEALSPAERAEVLKEAILDVMDIDAFNRELEAEREDAKRLAALREKVAGALTTALGGVSLPSEEGGRP